MKEIKFRFYDIQTKKMLPVEGIDFKFNRIISNYTMTDIKCKGEVINYTQECHDISHPSDLMQYTGLKDKTGKDIYECDILSVDIDISSKKTISIVKFGKYDDDEQYSTKSHYGYFIEYQYSFGKTTHSLHDIFRDSEIIGNIHETPELLELK